MPEKMLFRPMRDCVLISVLFFAAALSPANAAQPLSLAEAEALALQNEHGVAELRAGAMALESQSVSAGQLPDPQLRIGLANYPLSNGDFSSEAMTQAQLGIRQEFPRDRLRSVTSERLLALAAAEERGADARSRAVLEAARAAWLEAHYWQQAEQVLVASKPLFQDLLRVTESLYAVGRSAQSDVLRAELELQRLEDRLIDARQSLVSAQGLLSQWLGSDARRPIGQRLPDWVQLPPLSELEARVNSHPLLQAAEAEIDASKATVSMVEEKSKPGWALDLGYGYREGFNPDGTSRSDFISLAVVVDLPMFKKNRQDRDLSAALHTRSKAVSGKARLNAELQSRLQISYATWQQLTRRLGHYETNIVVLTRQQADAALLAYRSDAGNFTDVMLGQIAVVNTELEFLSLQIERAQAYTAIASLGGLE